MKVTNKSVVSLPRSSVHYLLVTDFGYYTIQNQCPTVFGMEIQRVLVADAVDSACVKLLEQHSIQVDCKYKLPADKLIAEIKVRVIFCLSRL